MTSDFNLAVHVKAAGSVGCLKQAVVQGDVKEAQAVVVDIQVMQQLADVGVPVFADREQMFFRVLIHRLEPFFKEGEVDVLDRVQADAVHRNGIQIPFPPGGQLLDDLEVLHEPVEFKVTDAVDEGLFLVDVLDGRGDVVRILSGVDGLDDDRCQRRRHQIHDLHQLFNLLRRQHGRGLIKDQNLILPVKHLQDFSTLLHDRLAADRILARRFLELRSLGTVLRRCPDS